MIINYINCTKSLLLFSSLCLLFACLSQRFSIDLFLLQVNISDSVSPDEAALASHEVWVVLLIDHFHVGEEEIQ